MSPSREELMLELVLANPAEKRDAFLEIMCEGDPSLRHRVDALLAANKQTRGLHAETAPAAEPTLKAEIADMPAEAVGQSLGRYKILEKVGEGGCGVVYVAEQSEPVRRRVALKVIKLGMDSKAAVARFEADFGIAKATEGRLTDATVYTHLPVLPATPQRATPWSKLRGCSMTCLKKPGSCTIPKNSCRGLRRRASKRTKTDTPIYDETETAEPTGCKTHRETSVPKPKPGRLSPVYGWSGAVSECLRIKCGGFHA